MDRTLNARRSFLLPGVRSTAGLTSSFRDAVGLTNFDVFTGEPDITVAAQGDAPTSTSSSLKGT